MTRGTPDDVVLDDVEIDTSSVDRQQLPTMFQTITFHADDPKRKNLIHAAISASDGCDTPRQLRLVLRDCTCLDVKNSKTGIGREFEWTAALKVPRAQQRVLLALDAAALRAATEGVSTWFRADLDPVLLHEYFRASVQVEDRRGAVVRIAFSADPEIMTDVIEQQRHDAPTRRRYDVTLQLVGLFFKRQYFTLVWRVVSWDASSRSNVPCLLLSDDDDNDDCGVNSDPDNCAAPDWDDVRALWTDAYDRICLALHCAESRVDELRAAVTRLESSRDTLDLRTIDEVLELL